MQDRPLGRGDAMKCPRCDADMSTPNKCSKCGCNIADNTAELEVEYKDFKTSELLEIRHKIQTAPPRAETKVLVEQPGEEGTKKEVPADPPLEAKKRSFPILTVVGLILALLIGGFFLVRLVLQK
jgi:hypothetical protein